MTNKILVETTEMENSHNIHYKQIKLWVFNVTIISQMFSRLSQFSQQHIQWVICHMDGSLNSELFTLHLTR